MTRHANRLSFALAALAALSGCATSASKRSDALRQELDGLVYEKPLDEVWQEARLLLAERDFPLAGADAKAVGQKGNWVERILSPARETSTGPYDPGLLQSLGAVKSSPPAGGGEQQWLDTGWNYYGERYHLEGRKLVGGCKVTFTKLKEDRTDRQVTKTRDVEIELDLARRLAPDAAERIEAKAQEAAR